MDIASLLKSKRLAEGLSQSQAAAEWHIPLKTLQGWEQGRNQPSAAHLARLLPLLILPGGSTSAKKKPATARKRKERK